MKKLFLVVILLFSKQISFGQKDTLRSGSIVTDFDSAPVFPGGEEALMKYLTANIKYPESKNTNATEGIVYISFVVDVNGVVSGAKVLRKTNDDLDKEVLRVVNNMPVWKPALKNKQPVNAQLNLPVRFSLNIEDDKKK
ncbi:MAG: energy transducer TonB [Bacteroidetes bacterium]|nr:energy transducer TonB [Bacteroidota bacterium]